MRLYNWQERWVSEEANHFNPAYCGVLIFEFVRAYSNAKRESPSYALLFCALPISLHPTTRKRLPKSTATGMFSWLQNNRDVKVGFADRAHNLTPFVREALQYAASRDVVSFSDGGTVSTGLRRASFSQTDLIETTTEVRDTVIAIRMIARWFAAAGDASTILAAWGIRV